MISRESINDALNRFNFYSGVSLDKLPVQERLELKNHAQQIKLKRKAILFKQNTYPNGVYLLTKGKLKVYQLNFDGSIQILFIYTVGEIFGYRPILSGSYQPVTIAALEDCELQFIDRKFFLDYLNRSITLSNQLLVSLSLEFSILTNRMNVFAQRGIKERLAFVLLILNEKFQNSNKKDLAVEIKLNRIDLANFVGTSAENLARNLNYFKENKLIRIEGKSIFIEDMEKVFILSAIEQVPSKN